MLVIATIVGGEVGGGAVVGEAVAGGAMVVGGAVVGGAMSTKLKSSNPTKVAPGPEAHTPTQVTFEVATTVMLT